MAVTAIIATRMPGKRLRLFTSKITARVAAPSANSTPLTFPLAIAPATDQRSLKGPALLILAVADRLRQKLGNETEPSNPGDDKDRP
jgi:hypothetical protein